MNWIDAIQNSAYPVWVRESPSIWAFTWILSLHAMGLAIIVGINGIVALRLLGFVPEIRPQALRKLFPWMYVGFTISVLRAVAARRQLDNDSHNLMFLLKLTFIALAMINMELMRAKVFDNPAFAAGGPRAVARAHVCAAVARAVDLRRSSAAG
jgi:hypothetical protein